MKPVRAVRLAGLVVGLALCVGRPTLAWADEYVAKIGDTGYTSLQAAVDAAPNDGTPTTIVLQQPSAGPNTNLTGGGVALYNEAKNGHGASTNKEIVIDFNGCRYLVDNGPVGSSGYESQAFHFEKGNKVTLKNGQITSAANNTSIKMLIQNYCDLTLTDMVIDGAQVSGNYVLSNNAGNVLINGSTSIFAPTNGFAFDLYFWPKQGYTKGPEVTIETEGTIDGAIEIDRDSSGQGTPDSKLTINGGTIKGAITVRERMKDHLQLEITGGTFHHNEIGKGVLDSVVADYIPVTYTSAHVAATVSAPEYWDVHKRVATDDDAYFQVGDDCFKSFKDARDAVPTDGTQTVIKALKNYTDSGYYGISNKRNVVLNLNEKKLSGISFALMDGNLTIQNGTIDGPSDGQTINVFASADDAKRPGDKNQLTIAKNATVNGKWGICLFPEGSTGPGYGSQIDVSGTLGGNIFVSGNIYEGNSVVNVLGDARIKTSDIGVALNGFATVNVADGASIEAPSGIEVRSGNLVVNGGTIKATGTYEVGPNGSGTTTNGAAIAVAQHTTKKDITVTIKGGTFTGERTLSIANPQGNSVGTIALEVEGGTFEGRVERNGDEPRPNNFITGGSFSVEPGAALIATDYDTIKINNWFEVHPLEASPMGDDNFDISFSDSSTVDSKPYDGTNATLYVKYNNGTTKTSIPSAYYELNVVKVVGAAKTSTTNVRDAGTYEATFTGTKALVSGKIIYFSGTPTKTLTITPIDLSGATVTVPAKEYTGSALTSGDPTVKIGANTVPASEYTVMPATETAVGTYDVTVTGNGNYTGTATGKFRILPRDADSEARIGTDNFLTVAEALDAATDGQTVTLLKNATLSDGALYVLSGKTITLDLGGKTLTARRVNVLSGGLTIKNGKLKGTTETKTNSLLWAYGSATPSASGYTVVNVHKDVTIENVGYAVSVGHTDNAAYGVEVSIDADATVDYALAYVNGNVNKTSGNVPKITIGKDSETTGGGVYAAGYAEWTIAGTMTSNDGDCLSLKSGKVTIVGGSYSTSGPFADPAEPNNNGSEDVGAALNLMSNDAYAKSLAVTVEDGTFTSANGYALHEGIASKGGTPSAAASYSTLDVRGGTFTGKADKGSVKISAAASKKVISGGNYNTEPPADYIADDRLAIRDALRTGYWTVMVAGATGVKLDRSSATMYVGNNVDLVATVSGNRDATVFWTSSNEAVASVKNGKVTAVGTGSATITARVIGVTESGVAVPYTATCSVAVTGTGSGTSGGGAGGGTGGGGGGGGGGGQTAESPTTATTPTTVRTPESPDTPATAGTPSTAESPMSPASPASPATPATAQTPDTAATPATPAQPSTTSDEPASGSATATAEGVTVLDATGQPANGWVQTDDGAEYYAVDGEGQVGEHVIDGQTYFFDAEGKLRTGWYADAVTGRHYYLYEPEDPERTGAMARDRWLYVEEDDGWYMLAANGAVSTGWCWDPATAAWYYMDGSSQAAGAYGKMRTGWICDDGYTWYYLFREGDNGVTGSLVEDGWLLVDGEWYYSSAGTGAIESGWKFWGGDWYYLSPARDGSFGMLQRGWFQDWNAGWYLSDPGNGALRVGWQMSGSRWFHLHDEHDGVFGLMDVGWYWSGNGWYFLGGDGAMLANTLTPDGLFVGPDGRWL